MLVRLRISTDRVGHHRGVGDELATTKDHALRARFPANPASVSGARRFVADGLRTLGRTALVDDATLCVSELAANAALHSAGTYMEIGIQAVDTAIRITVEDNGTSSAEDVVPRLGLELGTNDMVPSDERTTGRGLAIVSILASDWGVERLETGKRIWAELTEGSRRHGVRPPRRTEAVGPATSAATPEDWVRIRLLGCPVRLGLQQEQHLDELVRELQLINGDGHDPATRAIATRLHALLRGPANARHMRRRLARGAPQAGDTHIDIDMVMPRKSGGDVQLLHEAVLAADAVCEERRLLTRASSQELRSLRSWIVESIVGQIEADADPVSYEDWLAEQE